MLGSVSGGCVEGAVVKESKIILQTGESKRLHYGVSDDDAWAVGLSCGGKIQVFLQPFTKDAVNEKLLERLTQTKGCVYVTKLNDGLALNTLIIEQEHEGEKISEELEKHAQELYSQRNSRVIESGGSEYFVHVFPPRSKMLIIGAAHITADLIRLAQDFDFETIVIDPRQAFARNTVFSVPPDTILQAYPSEVLSAMSLDAYTYAVILSHDPKIDDDALKVLLRSPVAYIGALGSKKNHEKRTQRLQEAGFSESEIKRINAPIGVDINALGAKEIALSIMGAVIQAKNFFYR
jgi:xanthine dehydrogenase accessory factor